MDDSGGYPPRLTHYILGDYIMRGGFLAVWTLGEFLFLRNSLRNKNLSMIKIGLHFNRLCFFITLLNFRKCLIKCSSSLLATSSVICLAWLNLTRPDIREYMETHIGCHSGNRRVVFLSDSNNIKQKKEKFNKEFLFLWLRWDSNPEPSDP